MLAAIWLGPLALIVMTSIKPNSEFLNGPFALPKSPTFAPYRKVWNGLNFGVLLQNSLLYATTGSALAVLLALVPAFALSRFESPARRYMFALLLTGLMLPQQTVLIPLYDMLRWLQSARHPDRFDHRSWRLWHAGADPHPAGLHDDDPARDRKGGANRGRHATSRYSPR